MRLFRLPWTDELFISPPRSLALSPCSSHSHSLTPSPPSLPPLPACSFCLWQSSLHSQASTNTCHRLLNLYGHGPRSPLAHTPSARTSLYLWQVLCLCLFCKAEIVRSFFCPTCTRTTAAHAHAPLFTAHVRANVCVCGMCVQTCGSQCVRIAAELEYASRVDPVVQLIRSSLLCGAMYMLLGPLLVATPAHKVGSKTALQNQLSVPSMFAPCCSTHTQTHTDTHTYRHTHSHTHTHKHTHIPTHSHSHICAHQ